MTVFSYFTPIKGLSTGLISIGMSCKLEIGFLQEITNLGKKTLMERIIHRSLNSTNKFD